MNSNRRILAIAAAAALLTAAPFASAQVPISSMQLSFIQPTGPVVQNTDSIPVLVRFTNNDPTNSFVINTDLPTLGLLPEWLPLEGTGTDPDTGLPYSAPFASYTNASLNRGYGCSGNFTNVCDEGAYRFDFTGDTALDGPISIAPGASIDYELGVFVPVGGAAPPGTYEFYRAAMFLNFDGVDAIGRPLFSFTIPVQSCNFDTAAECTSQGVDFFTRTVVPEPGTWGLMGLGLAATALWARRRRDR